MFADQIETTDLRALKSATFREIRGCYCFYSAVFPFVVLPFPLDALTLEYSHRIRSIPIPRLRFGLFLLDTSPFTRRQEQVLLQPVLLRIKLEVSSMKCVQLFMGPPLDNPSLFDDEN